MQTLHCDVPKCEKALDSKSGYEIVRTAHVVDRHDRDADAFTDTVYACSSEHLAQLVPPGLADRFSKAGKKKRATSGG